MNRTVAGAALLAAVFASGGRGWVSTPVMFASAVAPQDDSDDAKIRALLRRIEAIAQRSDVAAYLDLLSGTADRDGAIEFATFEFRSGATRIVIQERDRQDLRGTLPGNGYSLVVDAFMEYGDRGRVATWMLEVKRVDDEWHVAGQQRLSAVENLYRLSVNPRKQFDVRNLTILGEDLELTLVEGSVFVVETDQGTTGLVLLGRGEMRFHPDPETEKGQVRIFAGSDTLDTRFDAAFVRVGTLEAHVDPRGLKARPVDPRDLKRAEQVFREESVKSFAVELGDLTPDSWSLLPGPDDFLAEVRTQRFRTLTYARSTAEAEDILLFERRTHRNIAVYTSKDKLAARGRFYNEDDFVAFDVLDYDIDVASIPARGWIDGHVVMRLKVNAPSIGQLTIRLANSLAVRSVTSNQFGRLFSLRVTNQNSILVNLPIPVERGTEMTITVEYGGRLEPQLPDSEQLEPGQRGGSNTLDFVDSFFRQPEPSFLYSNRSYWYPQATVTDYATATMRITVPATFGCVASGVQASDSPHMVPGEDPSQDNKVYVFTAERPVRYLAFLVSRLARADRWTVVFDNERPAANPRQGAADPGLRPYDKLDLIVDANPRPAARGKELAERAVDVVQFYESLIHDSPYSAFTLTLIDDMLPGGHSPGYFAVLNQPLPSTDMTWRNDPAAFQGFPEFFLAHEVAHQWWGQAVGWRNYHEQWLSEGFAQYFAALYAEKLRGKDLFEGVMRQMRKWALEESDQGPVYLGYRIGHIKNDTRIFRSIIYNKGALVLHMLRRLVGDDAFFRGLRRFYVESRFTKVGTDDFQHAMEAEAGRPLDRFFERWIYNATLPRVSFTYRVEGAAGAGSTDPESSAGPTAAGGSGTSTGQHVVLHFEQTGDLFDLPVTVILQYTNRRRVDIVVPVTERIVDLRVPLEGALRTAEISRDDGTLADITR